MSIIIRDAIVEDCPALLELIKGLYQHQGLQTEKVVSIEDFKRDGFGSNPVFHCLVAEDSDTKVIVGYCLYFYRYNVLVGKVIFIEDLFVSETQRGQGIGKQLWRRTCQIGLDSGCSRCQLEAYEWNERAIRLYERMGAYNYTAATGLHIFKLDKEEMIKFCCSTEPGQD